MTNTVTDEISIHALCEEGDRPAGGRVHCGGGISIHALCEEGDAKDVSPFLHPLISIHALCEEGDRRMPDLLLVQGDFYPRPLRGGRPDTVNAAMQPFKFLSTPSARRATREPTPRTEAMQFLSTPSARRATKPETDIRIDKLISIHALCEEGDRRSCLRLTLSMEFLSTPSARRATFLENADLLLQGNFYPRPLRGGRRTAYAQMWNLYQFLSTPSARRATYTKSIESIKTRVISIHALCEEGDERPRTAQTLSVISIHALCEEGDWAST